MATPPNETMETRNEGGSPNPMRSRAVAVGVVAIILVVLVLLAMWIFGWPYASGPAEVEVEPPAVSDPVDAPAVEP